jgi:hypothetical protein
VRVLPAKLPEGPRCAGSEPWSNGSRTDAKCQGSSGVTITTSWTEWQPLGFC